MRGMAADFLLPFLLVCFLLEFLEKKKSRNMVDSLFWCIIGRRGWQYFFWAVLLLELFGSRAVHDGRRHHLFFSLLLLLRTCIHTFWHV